MVKFRFLSSVGVGEELTVDYRWDGGSRPGERVKCRCMEEGCREDLFVGPEGASLATREAHEQVRMLKERYEQRLMLEREAEASNKRPRHGSSRPHTYSIDSNFSSDASSNSSEGVERASRSPRGEVDKGMPLQAGKGSRKLRRVLHDAPAAVPVQPLQHEDEEEVDLLLSSAGDSDEEEEVEPDQQEEEQLRRTSQASSVSTRRRSSKGERRGTREKPVDEGKHVRIASPLPSPVHPSGRDIHDVSGLTNTPVRESAEGWFARHPVTPQQQHQQQLHQLQQQQQQQQSLLEQMQAVQQQQAMQQQQAPVKQQPVQKRGGSRRSSMGVRRAKQQMQRQGYKMHEGAGAGAGAGAGGPGGSDGDDGGDDDGGGGGFFREEEGSSSDHDESGAAAGFGGIGAGEEDAEDLECIEGTRIRGKLPLNAMTAWDGRDESAGDWFSLLRLTVKSLKLNGEEAVALAGMRLTKEQHRAWHIKVISDCEREGMKGHVKWAAYKILFRERFLVSQMHRDKAWNQWKMLRMRAGETVRQFHERVISAADQVELQYGGKKPQLDWEEAKVQTFLNNLTADLANAMVTKRPRDLDEALQDAAAVETRSEHIKNMVRGSGGARRSGNVGLASVETEAGDYDYLAAVEHEQLQQQHLQQQYQQQQYQQQQQGGGQDTGWRQEMERMQTQLDSSMATIKGEFAALRVSMGSGGSGVAGTGGGGVQAGGVPPAAATPGFQPHCMRCGEKGHYTVGCPTVPAGKVVCWGCKKEGHKKPDCPERQKRSPLRCYRCGVPGHAVMRCTVDKNSVKCTYCGMVGHVEIVCAKRAQIANATAAGGGGGGAGEAGAGAGAGQGAEKPQRG